MPKRTNCYCMEFLFRARRGNAQCLSYLGTTSFSASSTSQLVLNYVIGTSQVRLGQPWHATRLWIWRHSQVTRLPCMRYAYFSDKLVGPGVREDRGLVYLTSVQPLNSRWTRRAPTSNDTHVKIFYKIRETRFDFKFLIFSKFHFLSPQQKLSLIYHTTTLYRNILQINNIISIIYPFLFNFFFFFVSLSSFFDRKLVTLV